MKELLLQKLAEFSSWEDKLNFAREFLQELILQIIDRKGYFKNLAFVGGTALRTIYDLPRFSEDLDFSLVNPKSFNFKHMLAALKWELELSDFAMEEAFGKEKTVQSDFIKFKGLPYDLGLSEHKNEKLFVKLEIDTMPPPGFITEIVMINKNFLFKVRCYEPASLFAAKLHAVLFRKYVKGRDYYDLLWFLTRKTPVNYELLSNAAAQTEKKTFPINREALKRLLAAKIDKADFGHIRNDVRPFLAKKEEDEYFRKEYFLAAIGKYFSKGFSYAPFQ
jgi:predicted nucleotidyltransferase component of viral defense system